MHFTSTACLLAASALTLTGVSATHRVHSTVGKHHELLNATKQILPCAHSHTPSAEEQAAVAAEIARLEASGQMKFTGDSKSVIKTRATALATRKEIIIPVHFHVMRANMTIEGGNIPLKYLQAQVDVLNEAWRNNGAPFRWVMAKPQYIDNKDWYLNGGLSGSVQEKAMKTTTRVGGPADCNIWLVYGPVLSGNQMLGVGLPPSQYNVSIGNWQDGIFLWSQTMPGLTSFAGLMKGFVGVHESAHWVGGVPHTCENGCSAIGDRIADTVPEREGTFGCPVPGSAEAKINQCPGQPEPDYSNFMDFTDEKCKHTFTPGQITFALANWNIYRGPNVTIPFLRPGDKGYTPK